MSRNLGWSSPLTLILVAACLVFAGLGARTFLQPAAAAAFFGAASDAAEAHVFVKAYGARNIAIALTALGLIWLDLRRGLVVLLCAAALTAALDAATMHGFSGWPGAAKHMAYVLGLGGLAALTWLVDPARKAAG